MLEKKTKITQITISENKVIFWKEVTEIIEDGKVLSTHNHRNSATPIDDITKLPEEIKPYAQMNWTPEVIQTYREKIIAGV